MYVELQERATHGDGNVLFTRERLRLFDGSVEGRALVLCVMGECFNVSVGEQFYGPEQHYNCFAGNDGSRAYVSGEFTEEGCHDDVSDLSGPQVSFHVYCSLCICVGHLPYVLVPFDVCVEP